LARKKSATVDSPATSRKKATAGRNATGTRSARRNGTDSGGVETRPDRSPRAAVPSTPSPGVSINIEALKRSEEEKREARDYAEAIVRTARDPLVILDADLRLHTANQAFYNLFKVSAAESEGRSIYELGSQQWDIPRLRQLLEDILPRESFFNDFEVTLEFENIGQRTMLLNARRLSDTIGQPATILLGIQDVTQLLHFQAELERSEQRYRRLFEAARDGVLLIDPNTRKTVDANPFMTELLGYPREELCGKELFEIGLLKDEEASRKAFRELEDKGFIRYDDLPLETKSGERREVEFVSNLYQEGEATIVQCNIRDITKRKRVEEALRDSEERYRTLFASAPMAVFVCDRNAVIQDYNQRAAELWGREPECGVEQHCGSVKLWLLDGSLLPHAQSPMVEVLRTGIPALNVEVFIERPDGSRMPVLVNFGALKNARGEITGAITSFIDITEQKHVEAAVVGRSRLSALGADVGFALTQSDHLPEMLRRCAEALVKHLDVAFARIWTLNEEEQVLELRASAGIYTHLDGPHSRVPIGRFKIGLIASERSPHLTNDVQHDPRVSDQEWAEREGMIAFAGYPLLVEERLIGVVAMFARLPLSEETLGVLASVVNGISLGIERKRTEEERNQLLVSEKAARSQAEGANRTKDEFLATVSHELRTPLNAILGWAEILIRGKLDEDTAARGLETIARNARAQNQLISDLLDVSRIITGQMRFETGLVELTSVIEAAADTVRPAAQAKGVELRLRLNSTAGFVSGDAGRLQQIVWNLLTNAVKFTPRDGRVDVQLKREGTNVVIIVSDTGEGLSPEFLPYIFDRFRQAEGTTTRQHGGLGLGLAIVRHLVEAHGGTARAASKGVGQGSTFTAAFPMIAVRGEGSSAETADDGELPADRASASLILQGLRVQVVDDEPDARELLSIVLKQRGAEVRSSATAGEALKMVKQWKPDVLVSDIGMPGEDGYDLIRRVRRLKSAARLIPALALTGYARPQDAARALESGYHMHLPKPVAPGDLVAAVASLAMKVLPF